MGDGLEGAAHVTGQGAQMDGANKLGQGATAGRSGGGEDAGGIRRKESLAKAKEGGAGRGPGTKRATKCRRWQDADVDSIRGEGSRGIVTMKGKANRAGDRSKKERASGRDRITETDATETGGQLREMRSRLRERQRSVGDVREEHRDGGIDGVGEGGMMGKDGRSEIGRVG